MTRTFTVADIVNRSLVVLALSMVVAATSGAASGQQSMPAHDGSHEPALGAVDFQNSCAPAVQAEFQRGVAMLHSYWFGYAGKTFRGVLEKDPGCAMAYWGMALDLLGNSLSGPPSRQNADAAWKILEDARAVPVKTERERAWLNAVRAYFRNHASVPLARRLSDYNDEMRKIASIYRNDTEAQVFYALTLQASASKADLTYANQLESAAILEKVFAANPRHPGATHFIIHAYDYAPLATRGIPAARRYAGIAPGGAARAAHAGAHLFHDRIVGRLDRLQPVGARDPARLLPCSRLHRVRLPAARAGREGPGHDPEGDDHACARRSSGIDVQLHGAGRDAGALCPRACGLEGGGRVAGHADGLPAGRFTHALHARSGPGTQRRRSRGQAGDRGDGSLRCA